MNEEALAAENAAQNSPLLTAVLEHNLWANLRLIDVCKELDAEQLEATAVGTYGSIYDTLVHIISGEQFDLRDLTASELEEPYWWDESPDLDSLREHAQEINEGIRAVTAAMPPGHKLLITYDNGDQRNIPVSLILAGAAHHSNEHRTQILTILTQLGVEPPNLSPWVFIRETIPVEKTDI